MNCDKKQQPLRGSAVSYIYIIFHPLGLHSRENRVMAKNLISIISPIDCAAKVCEKFIPRCTTFPHTLLSSCALSTLIGSTQAEFTGKCGGAGLAFISTLSTGAIEYVTPF